MTRSTKWLRLAAVMASSLVAVGCGTRSASSQAIGPKSTSSKQVVKPTATVPKLSSTRSSVVQSVGLIQVAPPGTGSFGVADYGEEKTCTFRVRNGTRQAVTLVVTEKSCECAGVQMTPDRLGPSDEADVVVSWIPKIDQEVDRDVRVRATVAAKENRRWRLVLEARGRIDPALRLNLPRGELDFGRLSLADLKRGKSLAIEVYTQKDRHRGFTIEASSSSRGLQLSPPKRLDRDRLEALMAVDGYRITITCRDGLPLGRFRETVRLRSSVYPDRDLNVTVFGWLESGAVSVRPEVVNLPERIPIDKGYRCPAVEVTLRGEPDRTLKLVRYRPRFLQVQVAPVQGKKNTWRITVAIPAGEEALRRHVSAKEWEQYLSYGFTDGELVFETNHSLVPVLRIPVPSAQFER